jgi:hypothetical protein
MSRSAATVGASSNRDAEVAASEAPGGPRRAGRTECGGIRVQLASGTNASTIATKTAIARRQDKSAARRAPMPAVVDVRKSIAGDADERSMPLLGHRSTEPAKRLKRSKITAAAIQSHPGDLPDARGPRSGGRKRNRRPCMSRTGGGVTIALPGNYRPKRSSASIEQKSPNSRGSSWVA